MLLQTGTLLGGIYRLIQDIGAGGGGIVYKAYHERLQTEVVVKQVKDRVKGILESRAEADILKNIKHTRLPRVYDFLEIDGEIFTVMDYIPGMSLDRMLEKEGRFDQKEVYRWLLQLADALAYLHSQEQPIIHSDIKPANIMLLPNRDICLIDFNVSLAFEKGLRTSTGVSGGYSPPEQYRDMGSYSKHLKRFVDATQTMTGGIETETLSDETEVMEKLPVKGDTSETASMIADMVGKGVDERSDIYSLGATAYHLLTGVKPSQKFEEIIPVTEYDVELSEGLGLIINKMMELDPDLRYQNGTQLLESLEQVYTLDSEYKWYRKRERNRKLFIAGLLAVGGVMAGTGFLTMEKEIATAYNRTVEAAGTLIKSASFEEAEEKLQFAVKLLPGEIQAYEKETLRLYSMGNYEEAIHYGRDVINTPPYVTDGEEDIRSLADIYYVVGNAYFEQQNYNNAIVCFKETIARNQENSLYFRDYAIALAKTGNVEEAEKTLETAISLGLGEDSIYMVQGEIAVARGDSETAVERLNASIQAASDKELFRRAVILCSQSYKKMGDTWVDEEIRLLEGAENQFGLEVSKHISEMLADAYSRRANAGSEDAKADFEEALARFTALYKQGYSTRQMMENIAILYEQMDRMDETEAMLLQMAEAYPKDHRAYKRLAFLEADRQQALENEDRDYTAMKRHYETALKLYEEAGGEGDTEMQMLETLMQDLKDGGWF